MQLTDVNRDKKCVKKLCKKSPFLKKKKVKTGYEFSVNSGNDTYK